MVAKPVAKCEMQHSNPVIVVLGAPKLSTSQLKPVSSLSVVPNGLEYLVTRCSIRLALRGDLQRWSATTTGCISNGIQQRPRLECQDGKDWNSTQ